MGRIPSVKRLYQVPLPRFLYQNSSPCDLPKKSGRCKDSMMRKKSKESNNSKCTLNTYYIPSKPDPLYSTSSINTLKVPEGRYYYHIHLARMKLKNKAK